ncbi:hypothetical protein HOLleu_36478 [Holothuria leucospilota]|uniref:Uncharacterized protein n=1 Tax=Holothuria leucospilota TaxID=206669 RepID=A0A9Q0YLZ8_HOLLE|nr:hypothetical protein HOLleu_36478 [Holothuria leucospilota]
MLDSLIGHIIGNTANENNLQEVINDYFVSLGNNSDISDDLDIDELSNNEHDIAFNDDSVKEEVDDGDEN